jgi:uncharacterized protein (TIGR02598 family)
MKSKITICRRFRSAAFSLVETVMALGIMGLAVTALLGLLPQGIEMSRKAANAAAETRIIDTIVSRLTAIPYSTLAAATGSFSAMRFDDQGVDVTNTPEEDQATFFASVTFPNGAAGGFVLPSSGSSAQPEAQMKRVKINIVQTPLRTFNFEAAAVNAPRSFSSVPIVLAPVSP